MCSNFQSGSFIGEINYMSTVLPNRATDRVSIDLHASGGIEHLKHSIDQIK